MNQCGKERRKKGVEAKGGKKGVEGGNGVEASGEGKEWRRKGKFPQESEVVHAIPPPSPVTLSPKDAPGRSKSGMIYQAQPEGPDQPDRPEQPEPTPTIKPSRPFMPSPLYYIIPQIWMPYIACFKSLLKRWGKWINTKKNTLIVLFEERYN